MNWDDVRFFLAVARTGTLSAAAADLHTTPSRVARRIAALEANLDAVLFRRSLDGYALTDAGEALVPGAEAMDQAARTLRPERTGESVTGVVRIASTDNIAAFCLAPHLPAFLAGHPGLRVEVFTGARPVDMPRSRIDLALRLVRPQTGNLTVRRLATMVSAYYASPNAIPGQVGWTDDLTDLPAAQAEANPSLTFAANTFQVQRAVLRAGYGKALLPCFIGDADPALVRVSPLVAAAATPLWLVQDKGLMALARVQAVAEFIVEAIVLERARIEGERPYGSDERDGLAHHNGNPS